ncbi:hypothetical protein JXA02_01435 [candidate division KSB1 bacterium]|nr:hypothetical protein [candidate division KSB1 bacterium]RQW11003.1 MAG: hypothetical protein EH222_01545 [candidate division KSB1 bacterium]
MRKIGHIINPVIVPPSSDLYIAQPITFASMKVAKEKAAGQLDIQLFSAQFKEDIPLIPPYFTRTPDLERSILDFGRFSKNKKLPLIQDILDRLYQNSDAEFFIYTNVDIALQPHFYLEVNHLLDRGYDAFVINRRTISSAYKSVTELPMMYKDPGKMHPGYDCFIFKRELYPKFKLGRVVIGTNRIGLTLITNLISYSQKMKIFRDLHLTFHIGEERSWRDSIFDDYIQFNLAEYLAISKMIRADIGRFYKYFKHYRALEIRRFVGDLKHL